MSNWGNWSFSSEIKNEISEFCTIVNQKYNEPEASRKWLKIHEFTSDKILDKTKISNDVMSFSTSDANKIEEEEMVNGLLQAVQFNMLLPESDLLLLGCNLLRSTLRTFQQKINEQEFLNFCKIMMGWKNQVILDECFNSVILPQLQDKNELSVCTVSSLKELAKIMPDKVCSNVLIPLLTDIENNFKDSELLNSLFPILPDACKDALISAFTKKDSFNENDWQMLQPLVSDLPVTSLKQIINVLNLHADEFSSNQIFARFLVALCKNTQCIAYKDQLFQVIEKNKTLLKRQALRLLQS